MIAYNVLKKAIISEKSTDRRDNLGQYTFQVETSSTKTDIVKSIVKLYDVKVDSVKTFVRTGKVKRRGKSLYKAKTRKFAIIKLAQGEKLPIFEEA